MFELLSAEHEQSLAPYVEHRSMSKTQQTTDENRCVNRSGAIQIAL
jgi:hypothetical protein